MIRTIIALILLIISILWLPLWVQIGLFVVAVLVVRYRTLLIVPAVFADALYAPTSTLSVGHFKVTMVVAALLVIWYIVATQTRLGTQYDWISK